MDPHLLSLAASAAQTLVQAMTTDTWNKVKERFASLLARQDTVRAGMMAETMNDTQAKLAGGHDPSAIAIGRWQGRFEGFLEQYPEAADELTDLLNELSEFGASSSVQFTVSAGRDAYTAGRDLRVEQARRSADSD